MRAYTNTQTRLRLKVLQENEGLGDGNSTKANSMIAERQFTAEDFRKRIQAMTEAQLLRYGKAAAYMADPKYSADGRTVEPVFKTQLQLCREEWRRRHPKAE